MTSSLKSRINFATVPGVIELKQKVDIVTRRAGELSRDYEVQSDVTEQHVEMLVTMFQELRSGATKDNKVKVKTPTTVLSTAEAISVLFNSKILGQHFRNQKVTHEDLAWRMDGTTVIEQT